MSFRYEPGDSLAHRLDPRSKLLVQVGFAAAAFAHTTPSGLVALTALTGLLLLAARSSPMDALVDLRLALPFLISGPILQGLTWNRPYFSVAEAWFPALASYRVLLLLFISAAYVRTTPVRESRAAVQRSLPGKFGQFLGMGIAFVFRFFPVLQQDIARIRDAERARLGDQRPIHKRMRTVTISGLNRAFSRADTFSMALRARCFAWNPTLPALQFSWRDAPALALGVGLVVVAVL